MDTLYDFNYASPTAVNRQEYTDVGAAAFYLGTCPRAFLGGTDFEIWTAAVGGTQLTEGVDYTISQNNARGDIFYSRQSGETVYSDVTIDNVTYQTGSIFITYRIIGSYITAETLNDLIYDRVPVGTVLAMPYSGAAPAGWDVCDGSAVSRTGSYAALFAKIGTTYGAGDGSTTFNLPDFQGYALRGYDAGVSAAIGTAQADALQRTTGKIEMLETSVPDNPFVIPTGVFDTSLTGTNAGSKIQLVAGSSRSRPALLFDNADSTTPNAAKTDDDETRMMNYAVQWVIKL